MKKDNAVNETNIAAAPADMEPNEADMLREQLAEERAKNEQLCDHVVQLSMALAAARNAKSERIESDMIGIVNANAANRDAREKRAVKAHKRDKALDKIFMQQCRLNAIVLCISIPLAIALILGGHFGFIHPYLATALSAIVLPVVGWAIHDCTLLFKFSETLKG